MKWLDTLERRFERYAIPNLINYVVIGQIAIYMVALLLRGDIANFLTLNRAGILAGQPWRLITFVLVPDNYQPLYFALGCYFTWYVGQSLEQQCGTSWFNLYYIFGMLGAWVSCLITGYGSAYTLSLSLFLAFAWMFPNVQLLLFFVIPVRVKWLGWLAGGLWAWEFLLSRPVGKLSLACEMLGFALFFGPDLWRELKAWNRRRQWRNQNRR